MLELHFWTTPNGYKPLLLLEELQLPYRLVPVDINTGAQFEPEFLKISPNNRIPALRDLQPADGGEPISVFESGAILLYLAEKQNAFLPQAPRQRLQVLEWLFWQMAGLGPMAGQNHHFSHYAPEPLPYAIDRYVRETARLYRVLNQRLTDRNFIADDYSIADMACYPWIKSHERQSQRLEDFPHLARWFHAISERPATQRAYDQGALINQVSSVRPEGRAILFGQTAQPIT